MEDQFNESEYLAANPDVAVAVRSGQFSSGLEHYEKYGKKEGRLLNSTRCSTREAKVLHGLKKEGLGLEIGPSHNPIAPKKRGFNVHILDHASAQELRTKYQGHGVNLDNIEDVDYVWAGQPLPELIGRSACYDWIIASHVIEHVPDFVSFLQQCETLLRHDGVLSLVIPDKRYCFDYFSPPTTTGNVLDAWAERRVRPSAGQVFDHIANAAKRNGSIAWEADDKGGGTELVHTLTEAKTHWARASSSNDYIDVHCWRFTPVTFRLILSDLLELNLINLNVKTEFDTTDCEFYISLSKTSENYPIKDRLSSLQESMRDILYCQHQMTK